MKSVPHLSPNLHQPSQAQTSSYLCHTGLGKAPVLPSSSEGRTNLFKAPKIELFSALTWQHPLRSWVSSLPNRTQGSAAASAPEGSVLQALLQAMAAVVGKGRLCYGWEVGDKNQQGQREGATVSPQQQGLGAIHCAVPEFHKSMSQPFLATGKGKNWQDREGELPCCGWLKRMD